MKAINFVSTCPSVQPSDLMTKLKLTCRLPFNQFHRFAFWILFCWVAVLASAHADTAQKNTLAPQVLRLGVLPDNLFELHFQGVHQTDTRKLSHLEVLVRMRDSTEPENLIMPGAFIPSAEKTAQIVEIDRWVLDRSIALLALHPELPTLAVNISGRSFDEPSLPDYIKGK